MTCNRMSGGPTRTFFRFLTARTAAFGQGKSGPPRCRPCFTKLPGYATAPVRPAQDLPLVLAEWLPRRPRVRSTHTNDS